MYTGSISVQFKLLLAKSILMLLSFLVLVGGFSPSSSWAEEFAWVFEEPSIFVVYSETDDDAQILIRGGSEEGIKKVLILGPRGMVRHRARFKDTGRIGQADFSFDTPEPSLQELKEAYPPGYYRFWGKTVEGDILASTVELSYELLDPPTIIYPEEGDEDIPIRDLVVLFIAPEGTESIRLEIEDEETEDALKVDLSADASTFEVPNNWLQPGVEYTLDIKVIGEKGNQTVRDIRFITEEFFTSAE